MSDLERMIEARYREMMTVIGNKTLIAVSKYTTIEHIRAAYQIGIRDFGESRVQDLAQKAAILPSDIRWHFIGSLQKNKINNLLKIKNLHAIHSVDSLELLNALIARADQFEGEAIKILFQINTSGEEQKGGFIDFSDCELSLQRLIDANCSKLSLHGLMTIGKIRTDYFEQDAIESFKMLGDWKTKLDSRFTQSLTLSMGMSSDYKIAIAMGSDYVRIGGALFD